MKDKCDGCSYKTIAVRCYKIQDGSCPCTNCLVKMMCDYGCESWDEWYKTQSKKLHLGH